MSKLLHIYRNTGWLGHGDRPAAEGATPPAVTQDDIQQQLWSQNLLDREFADDKPNDSKQEVLLPTGFGGDHE